MNKKSKLILGLFALMLPFQFQALAETSQGTITSIDLSGPSFNLLPSHGDTESASVVNVRTAPGARYNGVDSFDGLQVGDYVEIDALSKSKTGSTLEATHIDRRFVATENVHYAAAMRITQTTITTTATVPVIVQTTPVVVVQNPVTTTYKSSETIKDGNTVRSSESRSMTAL